VFQWLKDEESAAGEKYSPATSFLMNKGQFLFKLFSLLFDSVIFFFFGETSL